MIGLPSAFRPVSGAEAVSRCRRARRTAVRARDRDLRGQPACPGAAAALPVPGARRAPPRHHLPAAPGPDPGRLRRPGLARDRDRAHPVRRARRLHRAPRPGQADGPAPRLAPWCARLACGGPAPGMRRGRQPWRDGGIRDGRIRAGPGGRLAGARLLLRGMQLRGDLPVPQRGRPPRRARPASGSASAPCPGTSTKVTPTASTCPPGGPYCRSVTWTACSPAPPGRSCSTSTRTPATSSGQRWPTSSSAGPAERSPGCTARRSARSTPSGRPG